MKKEILKEKLAKELIINDIQVSSRRPNQDDFEVLAFIVYNLINEAREEDRRKAVEVLAEHLYDQMPHNVIGTKPRWVVNGNSLKQDEARVSAFSLLFKII